MATVDWKSYRATGQLQADRINRSWLEIMILQKEQKPFIYQLEKSKITQLSFEIMVSKFKKISTTTETDTHYILNFQ